MSEENKAIARRALEEIFSAQGDLDVADELIAPTLGGVELLIRPGKRQTQLGDPGTQSSQLISPLSFSSVDSY
jgi:hypothetical protein